MANFNYQTRKTNGRINARLIYPLRVHTKFDGDSMYTTHGNFRGLVEPEIEKQNETIDNMPDRWVPEHM